MATLRHQLQQARDKHAETDALLLVERSLKDVALAEKGADNAASNSKVAAQEVTVAELQAQLVYRTVKDSEVIAQMDANKDGTVSGAEVEKHVRGMEGAKSIDRARISELVAEVAELKSKVESIESRLAKAAEKENMLKTALEENEAEVIALDEIDVRPTAENGALNAEVAALGATMAELKEQEVIRKRAHTQKLKEKTRQ